jgi:hypothetical protein
MEGEGYPDKRPNHGLWGSGLVSPGSCPTHDGCCFASKHQVRKSFHDFSLCVKRRHRECGNTSPRDGKAGVSEQIQYFSAFQGDRNFFSKPHPNVPIDGLPSATTATSTVSLSSDVENPRRKKGKRTPLNANRPLNVQRPPSRELRLLFPALGKPHARLKVAFQRSFCCQVLTAAINYIRLAKTLLASANQPLLSSRALLLILASVTRSTTTLFRTTVFATLGR